ncbi:1-deoxy-D-xylulose-5-phosphate reductoisomerase [Candidatus Pelagibacter sp. Uisw_113]|uniref:1-deoxy-D-xylulose-5-phosphate reductoisomerase n=1 Tax=Candidatus Pelagibacter sp. Uisw_113 TaxID=3230994 RepID=UPI0039E8C230
MKKKIAILGSTGSIGKTTIAILKKNKDKYKIVLLTSNKNINELIKQSKFFNVKNLIVTDKKKFNLLKKKLINKKINIFNDFNSFNKIFNNKIDYTMSSISGLEGLKPTLDIIKFTKKIAIANKESIICGWNLINQKLIKYKTIFIPVDSEHFSIWSLINNSNKDTIDEIIITASGGPFLKTPVKNLKNVSISQALKHPNWAMGKKISIDSATMMNKVFEVIEAQKIFNISIKKFKILIHPRSYLHAIVKFNNGLIKMLIHDTNMSIPIFNSINDNEEIKTNKINYSILNNLSLSLISKEKYPSIKILENLDNRNSLYETAIVSVNDELVSLFINKKIKFTEISKNLEKILNYKEILKFKHKSPKNFEEIIRFSKYVRLKTLEHCI